MSAAKTAVIVLGSAGRAGSNVVKMVLADPLFSLSAALDVRTGADRGALEAALPGADVVIDFTAPSAGPVHAALCARYGKPLVIGTTGFTAAQEAAIRRCAGHGRRAPSGL
jgi:4-hydroxy-tetrahydrodipicolinate reductase